jgi:dCTP deaminase
MILPAQEIRRRFMVDPFHERTRQNGMTFGLGPAGYDVRIAEDMVLSPGDFQLASTIERFQMPNDVMAYVKDKSSWARRGLVVQNTVIEPGWRGWLTLELTYHMPTKKPRVYIKLEKGMPIAQIVFHQLMEETTVPYSGKYQDQQGGPQSAILEGD